MSRLKVINGFAIEEIEQAVVDLQTGNQQACNILFGAYWFRLVRFFNKYVNKETAEDLASETFLLVFRGISRYRRQPGNSFSDWIMCIANNVGADYYKNTRSSKRMSKKSREPMQPICESPEELFLSLVESYREVVRLINAAGCTPGQKTCLLLLFINELTDAEAAEYMNMSSVNFKSLKYRALQKLRMYLEKQPK